MTTPDITQKNIDLILSDLKESMKAHEAQPRLQLGKKLLSKPNFFVLKSELKEILPQLSKYQLEDVYTSLKKIADEIPQLKPQYVIAMMELSLQIGELLSVKKQRTQTNPHATTQTIQEQIHEAAISKTPSDQPPKSLRTPTLAKRPSSPDNKK